MSQFTFPHARKVRPLETDGASLQGPEFSNMGNFKRSHSRDRKTLPTCGNVKDLLPRIGRLFQHGRDKKNNSQYIMLQYHDATMAATVVPTTAGKLATAPARACTRKEHGRQ
jgi:hypothetical protein